jgi:hypothetical protein
MAWLRSRRANLAFRSRLNRALSPLKADIVSQRITELTWYDLTKSMAPHIEAVTQSNTLPFTSPTDEPTPLFEVLSGMTQRTGGQF